MLTIGSGWKGRLFNPTDAYWDWRLGVQTFGYYPASGKGTSDWRVHYAPTRYDDVFRHLRRVGVHQNDVFTDLGSGLGRAVFAASWAGARRAVGVDIVQELCALATANHASSKLADRDISFVCMSGGQFDLSDTTILFMAHPFGEDTMRQVVEGIERSNRATPLRVIYLNPIFDRLFAQSKQFKSLGHAPIRASLPGAFRHYPTAFWQTV